MPLYEFLRLAIEKLESSEQKPCPVDPCLESENELVDTGTRSPTGLGIEKCGGVEYIFKEISHSDPWLSYGSSSDHLDNSFRPLSDPSIQSDDDAIALPGSILAAQPKELLLHGMAKNISPDTFMNKDKCAAYSVRALDGDRATSSVSSRNRKHMKNKEELECQSDELQNASKKAEGGRGSKRRRAAEVHNLSERRRRDRMNQKMQALQQLIPNCNKADKASMLDEAIEYLKKLKHQVQRMSMGCGWCVMHPGHMPRFSYMGMGMDICPVFPSSAVGLVNLHATPGMCGSAHLVGWHQMRPTSFINNSHTLPAPATTSSPTPHAHQN